MDDLLPGELERDEDLLARAMAAILLKDPLNGKSRIWHALGKAEHWAEFLCDEAEVENRRSKFHVVNH